VVEHPDGNSPHAFVVGAVDLDAVNATLPDFAQIRHLTLVPAIPRTPGGKVDRRTIARTLAGATMVTFINNLTVTGDVTEFEQISAKLSDFMSEQPGYRKHALLRSLRRPEAFVEIAEWDDAEAHQRAVRSDSFQQLIRELAKVVAKPQPDLYEAVR